jgi:hypothetical protein
MPLGEPGSAEKRIVDCYKLLMGPSRFTPPQRPETIRVSAPLVADKLRAVLAGVVQVVCAPTPELDSQWARKDQEFEVYIPRWDAFDREQLN